MRINSINAHSQSFKGRAYVNYYGVAHNVQESPYPTQQSIIGNINSLKQRLESQTPDDKTFIINYGYETQKDSIFLPTYHYGTIKVSDEKGNSTVQEFSLGKSGGSRKDDRTVFASGEEIWNNGFRPITEAALNGIPQSNKDEKILEEIKAEIKERGWVEEDIKPWRNPNYEAIGAETEQDLAEIKAIYERIEEETAKEKSYYFSVINATPDYTSHALEIEAGTNESYYTQYLRITNYGKESDWKNYCVTDSEQIYRKVFKPLTDKTLWDGHNYLPFKNDWAKREVVNKLS